MQSLARERTRRVMVGSVPLGGGSPVVVQSMTCTPTVDADATLAQVNALVDAGCDLVRVTVPSREALGPFERICRESPVPIVADIHFDYRLAIGAVRAGAAKLRINPGNIGDWERVDAVIDAAGEAGAAIRIGVNAGSLDKRIAERDDLTQPEKLVASSLEFVEHFEKRGFDDIVLSAKAHSVPTTIETYRALSRELPHVPLHLGVTEAGTVQQGTIKSAVGLGVLLAEGIGDTMRVSLTADPVEEPPVCWGILQSLGLRRRGPELVSCPTCGRTQVDLIGLAEEVAERLKGCSKPVSVAVMGCVVNGPGEASDADDTTYEITLRKDAKFSDGTPVTANDVADSFLRSTAEGNIYIPMLAPIASVEAKDDTTVTVKTTVPNFSLLKERLAIVRVVPASSTKEDMTAKPVGSGPWMYDVIDDSKVEMVPNPEYNGDHPAKDEKLHIDILVDPTARVQAQQEGTTLVMEMVTADAVDQLQNAGCQMDTVDGFGTRFMLFNTQKAPWDNVKARQAVMFALDYEKMIENAFAGLATAPTCYLPKSYTNYNEASVVYKHDVEKAKKLLEEAGVTGGSIKLLTTDNEQVKSMSVQVQQDLKELGFDAEIVTRTTADTYADIDAGGDFDLLLAPGDPSCFGADPDLLMNWWYGDNAWMKVRARWSESAEWKELTELMASALGQAGDDQQKTWNKCFDMIAEQAVLYPVLQVKTVTASWRDTPNGEGVRIDGFKGIGTTGMSFIDCATVTE